MKFLILFLISFNLYAGNFASKSEVESKTVTTVYSKMKSCETAKGLCLSIPYRFNKSYHEYRTAVFLKEQTASCTDEADCQTKLETLVCTSQDFYSVKNLDSIPMEVYCTKYQAEGIYLNQALKDSYDAAMASEMEQEAAIAQAMKAINYGKRIIALLAVRNVPKNLTTIQIEQMNVAYNPIKGLLETGSLLTAKEKIAALVPDGVLVTAEDQAALIAEINKFFGL